MGSWTAGRRQQILFYNTKPPCHLCTHTLLAHTLSLTHTLGGHLGFVRVVGRGGAVGAVGVSVCVSVGVSVCVSVWWKRGGVCTRHRAQTFPDLRALQPELLDHLRTAARVLLQGLRRCVRGCVRRCVCGLLRSGEVCECGRGRLSVCEL